MGRRGRFDVTEFLHELVVNLQAPSRIDNQNIMVA